MTGEVGILNIGAGDTKLTFDPTNPQEMIRAARIVKDMVRRGYALLVEVKGAEGQPSTYRRAYDFDESTCEYIIADLDQVTSQKADELETTNHEEVESATTETASAPRQSNSKKNGFKPRTKRVHASTTRTVAVARTAGG